MADELLHIFSPYNHITPMSTSFELGYKKHLTHIDEWRKMADAGVFSSDSRIELINGEILEMSPIGSQHSGCINRLNHLLSRTISDQAIISIQNPLDLGDFSQPQPDLMLLKPSADYYASQHPKADDVLLLIEVADSSLPFDQNQKLQLYALHGVSEYWLINLTKPCLEIYRKPGDGVYQEKMTLFSSDRISLLHRPDIEIQMSDILAPRRD